MVSQWVDDNDGLVDDKSGGKTDRGSPCNEISLDDDVSCSRLEDDAKDGDNEGREQMYGSQDAGGRYRRQKIHYIIL